jgi:hypothetical protein
MNNPGWTNGITNGQPSVVSQECLLPLGFLAKRRTKPSWFVARTLRQVCSVSECIANAPPNATFEGRNRWGFYDSEDSATAVVSATEEGQYEVFAYRLLLSEFDDGGRRDVAGAPFGQLAHVELTDWASIGFDIVADCSSQSIAGCCSPLTCNGLIDRVATNDWGLLGTLQQAVDLAEALGQGRLPAEPGPYFVLEVLRH